MSSQKNCEAHFIVLKYELSDLSRANRADSTPN